VSSKQSVNQEPLSKEEYETLALHRYVIQQFLRFSEGLLQKAGLTPQQYQAMLAIKANPDWDYMTMGELADCLLIRPHSAVGLVNRLEARGLLARQTSETDRRQVHVRLTEQGSQVLDRLAQRHVGLWRQLGPQLRAISARLGEAA